MINTFTEAVQTVDIEKAVGKPHTIWVHFAKFYEEHEQIEEVRETQPIETRVNIILGRSLLTVSIATWRYWYSKISVATLSIQ